ncbi:hypothetical protein [Oharaeibacter diazotrophicus]|uniref:Uncharacterized protein n=1 Tax=Oharaeibacter diazotrophicus TaxID=1920512 RepID=A0A4R6RIA0_9HYPH|nr:hypothetical protein [Oharaeibacter diazotrophicus]TDP86229.1 hypothetical protein EDD54_0097 [Oharaeibacter diazotrophicus]BBE71829.1 hypothetical protein OHA_1_01414 [Pleomorphomonas sp. SM30]GLS78594.1 hypothetical protein GCM10007904_39310 [Oharaeibacter diazotrophicus]
MADAPALAGLRPPHLPAVSTAVAADDLGFAVAVGIVAALALVGLALLLARGRSPAAAAAARVRAAAALPPDERISAVATVLRDHLVARGRLAPGATLTAFVADFRGSPDVAEGLAALADGLYAPADEAAARRGSAAALRVIGR